MNTSKTIRCNLNGLANEKMYVECVEEARNIIHSNDFHRQPNGLNRLVRYSSTGNPSWCCRMLNKKFSGLGKKAMVRAMVNNYLKENTCHPDKMYISKAYISYRAKRMDRSVRIIQKRWRFKQIRHMRPFYLEPTQHSDSRPYLYHPKYNLYKVKPSFRMVYFKVNNRIVTRDLDTKGGPRGVHSTSWYFDLTSESIYWTYTVGYTIFEVRKWIYGKDFTVKITKDVQRFRGILGKSI